MPALSHSSVNKWQFPKMVSATARHTLHLRLDNGARVGLLTAGVIALVVLLRSVHLTASGQRQFTSLLNVCLYYVIPAAVAATLFWGSFRLTAPQRLKLVAAGTSLVLSLYAGELLLGFWGAEYPTPPMVAVARATDKPEAAAWMLRTSGSRAPRQSC